MRTLVITLLLLSTHLVAQQMPVTVVPPQCPLSIMDSPKLRGLKLGMSKREVERSLKRKIDPVEIRSSFMEPYDPPAGGAHTFFTKRPIGVSIYSFYPKATSEFPRNNEMPDGVQLAFFNGELAEYTLYYDIDEFNVDTEGRSAVVRKLKLPERPWRDDGTSLTCRGFRISIRYPNDNNLTVRVTNIETLKLIDKKARESVRKDGPGEGSH